jgi:DNA-damage-inducible protein J
MRNLTAAFADKKSTIFPLNLCVTCVIHKLIGKEIIMHKIATINTRIEPKLKAKAEHIFQEVGLSSAEAIRLFYKQVCLNNGLPFEVKIPNKKTVKAIQDAKTRKTQKAKSVSDIFKDLD